MNIGKKTVLITGANRGIGLALVNEALRRGAKRVYAGTRSALQNGDERMTHLTLDVTSASEIERAAGKVDALDVLINNAGIALYDDLSTPDAIERHLAVNPRREGFSMGWRKEKRTSSPIRILSPLPRPGVPVPPSCWSASTQLLFRSKRRKPGDAP